MVSLVVRVLDELLSLFFDQTQTPEDLLRLVEVTSLLRRVDLQSMTWPHEVGGGHRLWPFLQFQSETDSSPYGMISLTY